MTSLVEVTSSTYLQDLLSSRGEKKRKNRFSKIRQFSWSNTIAGEAKNLIFNRSYQIRKCIFHTKRNPIGNETFLLKVPFL